MKFFRTNKELRTVVEQIGQIVCNNDLKLVARVRRIQDLLGLELSTKMVTRRKKKLTRGGRK